MHNPYAFLMLSFLMLSNAWTEMFSTITTALISWAHLEASSRRGVWRLRILGYQGVRRCKRGTSSWWRCAEWSLTTGDVWDCGAAVWQVPHAGPAVLRRHRYGLLRGPGLLHRDSASRHAEAASVYGRVCACRWQGVQQRSAPVVVCTDLLGEPASRPSVLQ